MGKAILTLARSSRRVLLAASGRSGATGRDNLCAAQAARLLACKAAFGNYSARQSLPAIYHSLKLGKQERR